jgi:hydroxymethylpyrimidine pyrophosphatase-like HAD family hydrolase
MIEIANIGIAMGNTRFEELKEKADHVSTSY